LQGVAFPPLLGIPERDEVVRTPDGRIDHVRLHFRPGKVVEVVRGRDLRRSAEAAWFATESNPMLEAALSYAKRGWHVFPLKPQSKLPLSRSHGHKDASCDEAQIVQWWMDHPSANVGLACAASGLVVVDIDPRNGGDIEQLNDMPPTAQSFTGGGGQHLFFRAPANASFPAKLAEGIDLKSNGYVVLPPSVHPSGRIYAWDVDAHPDDVPLADFPIRRLEESRRQRRGLQLGFDETGIRASIRPGNWWFPVRSLVWHWAMREGWGLERVLAQAESLTLAGWTVAQTCRDLKKLYPPAAKAQDDGQGRRFGVAPPFGEDDDDHESTEVSDEEAVRRTTRRRSSAPSVPLCAAIAKPRRSPASASGAQS
jgi:hypothetical protein